MGRMVRKQLYIDARQEALLKERSARTGETESALIRQAIDAVYDPETWRHEGERRAARFNAVFDEVAEELARAGVKLEPIRRAEFYKDGRPR